MDLGHYRYRVSADPAVCHGQPCITGTRVPVDVVLDSLTAGLTPEAVLAAYPSLPPDAIPVSLAFAAAMAPQPTSMG